MFFLFLFIFNGYAQQYSPKSEVEKCINESAGKLSYTYNLPISNSCLSEYAPCTSLPNEFSCIYYSFQGELLIEDPIKKDAYTQMFTEAETIKTDFQTAEILDSIRNYCLYVYSTSCETLPASEKQKVKKSIDIKYGKVKQEILYRLKI